MLLKFVKLASVSAALLAAQLSFAIPLRDLVSIEGIRENQLIGYGLVVGLDGTGDKGQVKFAEQSVSNLLRQFGLKPDDKSRSKTKNVAAVMVSANLPSGYRKGQTIDVTVSSMGDAKSLRGGTLLLTPLKAANGQVYAIAQGNLVTSAVSAEGESGSSVTINTPTAGRIPNGATIEQEIPSDFTQGSSIRLNLTQPNFETATNVVDAINQHFGDIASANDPTSIQVIAPAIPTQRVGFVAELEKLNVTQGAEKPRVIFNSRTGTVVISEGVTVRPAAVSHGGLKVVISENPKVSQPRPFANGRTKVVPNSQVDVSQEKPKMFLWPASTRLQTIIDTLNKVGAGPDDIMAILQGLDQAGALNAQLIVI